MVTIMIKDRDNENEDANDNSDINNNILKPSYFSLNSRIVGIRV